MSVVAVCLASEATLGQWTVDFVVDQQNAEAALGAARVGPMTGALARVKTRLERILTGSTGAVVFTLTWASPVSPTAIGEAQISLFYGASAAVARDRLINQAEADNEPAAEVALYNALPAPNIPFFWSGNTGANATSVVIPSALNKHLGFAPQTTSNDGTITMRPPSATLKWQFWNAQLKPGHQLFEAVVFHECCHLLGFVSRSDATVQPTALCSWDLFRFAESNVPASTGQFLLLPRELRPTVEASWITRVGDPGAIYKASRGARTGGDGFDGSHWRSESRLTPRVPVGVMDPSSSTSITFTALQSRYYTRADVEALDIMGWNVQPTPSLFAVADTVSLVSPPASAVAATGAPLTFEWSNSGAEYWTLYIYQGSDASDDEPFRVYDNLTALTVSVPPEEALPAGQYVWYVVASTNAGIVESEHRALTVQLACPADFNGDGNVDPDDLADFIACYFSLPACPEGDFNHDGIVDPDDLADYVAAHFEGC